MTMSRTCSPTCSIPLQAWPSPSPNPSSIYGIVSSVKLGSKWAREVRSTEVYMGEHPSEGDRQVHRDHVMPMQAVIGAKEYGTRY
ncbi:unnamed protein product [Haemonchus placei]|uniref:HNH endonuclease n=1 Tax=Haemonchus placei TaxID=6290 RepID=A0A0N4W421_HAEPC|nr:unnamed protein product [Haemonchus placei]